MGNFVYILGFGSWHGVNGLNVLKSWVSLIMLAHQQSCDNWIGNHICISWYFWFSLEPYGIEWWIYRRYLDNNYNNTCIGHFLENRNCKIGNWQCIFTSFFCYDLQSRIKGPFLSVSNDAQFEKASNIEADNPLETTRYDKEVAGQLLDIFSS